MIQPIRTRMFGPEIPDKQCNRTFTMSCQVSPRPPDENDEDSQLLDNDFLPPNSENNDILGDHTR